MVESGAVVKNKTNSAAGTPERAFLVVDADGERAEALRAELESRGFAVSVRRAKSAEEAAGPDAVPSERELELLFRNLTKLEIKLLWALLRSVGRTVSKQELYQELYDGYGPIESRALDPLVRRLKSKLGPAGRSIETQRGVGVCWNPDPVERNGFATRRVFEALAPFRAAVLALFVVAAFAAGWFLRPGARGGGPEAPAVPAEEAERIPLPPPSVEAMAPNEGTAVAPGHEPERSIDGNPDTWFQTDGPARKRDLLLLWYRPAVKGTLSVRCGVPGSTNAVPSIKVWAQRENGRETMLGFVDRQTGAFSSGLGDDPIHKVFLVVAADSDEPFAVQSVRVDP